MRFQILYRFPRRLFSNSSIDSLSTPAAPPFDLTLWNWREGSKVDLNSRFSRVRVVVGRSGDDEKQAPQWLLIEWPQGEADPEHFVLSTLPKSISLKEMIRTVKNRWRIERSYEDLKGQMGLDHYEGRSFIGWHHHVTVALVCYAFLVAEQARASSPQAPWTSSYRSIQHAA